jgi:acyl-[acyl-carrier-protein] desaturase
MTSLLVPVLSELEPVVARELDRHLAAAREWMPHEYVPWSLARDFDGPMGGEAWDVSQSSMSAVVRTALVVNLLTEDNLPSYHREIHRCMGSDGAWATWIGRWTAEEGRHGTAIRDYLLVTRAVDPTALERERMVHMTGGYGRDNDPDVFDTLAYVTFQELATRIAHRNTGKQSGDPVCERLLTRIATDENLHMVFYRNMLDAALELAPDRTMEAIWGAIEGFKMPGSTIEGFGRRSLQIAMAGIYDLRIHRDEVLMPVVRQLGLLERTGLGDTGRVAQAALGSFLEVLDAKAARFESKRAAALEIEARRQTSALS